MATIKKVRIAKGTLPPVTVPTGDSFSLTSAVSKPNLETGARVYEYTSSQNHGLSAGDAIEISGIDPEIFNATNVIVYSTPTTNTFQILGPSTSSTYVSGGEVTATYGNYIVRYRIVSEDRNRLSHWSPQHVLSPVSRASVDDEGIFVQAANGTLSATWDVPANSTLQDFDVYVAWGTGVTQVDVNEGVGSYTYQATVSGNFFSMPIPNVGYTRVSVSIQTRTYPRKYWPEIVFAKSSVLEI